MSDLQESIRDVEYALEHMRLCEQNVKNTQERLEQYRKELTNAEGEFNESKERLFRDFPELAPKQPVASEAPQTAPVVEAQPTPVMGPQGPMVFREMDDDPFAFGGD